MDPALLASLVADGPEAKKLLRESACVVPPGESFVPSPSADYQIYIAVPDGQGGQNVGVLEPPAVANNQCLRFGSNGPYWANEEAVGKKEALGKHLCDPPGK